MQNLCNIRISPEGREIVMKSSRKHDRILLNIAVLLILAAIVYLFFSREKKVLISSSRNAIEMGTAASVTLHDRKGFNFDDSIKKIQDQTIEKILNRIDDLDNSILSWRSETSETYTFNHIEGTEPFPCSEPFSRAISGSLKLSENSGGALDITLRPVIDAWGIEAYDGSEPYLPPEEMTITELKKSVGSEHLSADERLVQKDDSAVQIDFGAVGKGYALDTALSELINSPVDGAVISVGGSILIYGDKGEPWQIGIRDPEGNPTDFLGRLSIPGTKSGTAFISTSGGYEKYVEYEGEILEHIIDGRTLSPVQGRLYSATIITYDDGLVSDGLSTACYILGMENSGNILEQYHAEAIFVTKTKEVYITEGLSGMFAITDSSYKFAGVLYR